MKLITVVMLGVASGGLTGLAMANPALLSNHPGYPSRGEFAYDTGRQSLTRAQSLEDATESGNANIVQQLENPATPELLRQEGADLLPSGQAPSGKRAPPGAEMKQGPK